MKIVHVVEAFGGGTLTAVAGLANHFARSGNTVEVIHSLRPDTPSDGHASFTSAVTLTHLPMPQGVEPAADVRAALRLRRMLQARNPDIVHLHSSKAGALGRLALIGTPLARRTIYCPHGFAFNRQDISPRKQQFYRALEKWLARLSPAQIQGCSLEEAATARTFSRTATAIQNAVDVDELERLATVGRSHAPAQKELPLVVMAGRNTAARDPAIFQHVALEVRKAGVPAQFLWLGDGDYFQFDPELVTTTGWLSKADLMATLKDATLYLHCAKWDALPYAVLEAMALAKPVLASAVGGIPELVTEGVGMLANSTPELVGKAIYLANPSRSAQLCLDMGAAGREHVRRHFNKPQQLQQYESLYLSTHLAARS